MQLLLSAHSTKLESKDTAKGTHIIIMRLFNEF